MSITPHHGLPLLAAAQAQKHVTLNEALILIDGLMHLAVQERNRNDPPEQVRAGDRYVIGAAPTGYFVGKAGMLAAFDGSNWNYSTLRAGCCLYSINEKRIFIHDGTGLKPVQDFIDRPDSLTRLGIGTGPDANNVLSVKGDAALFAAADTNEGGNGSFRFTLNKGQESTVLSQLYQTNWSGRAETGLIGDESFRIKMSPNGSSWFDALIADPSNGSVSLPSGLSHIGGGPLSFRNLIVNPEGSVAQRGPGPFSLSGAGALAAFDRWRLLGSAASNATLARSFVGATDSSSVQASSFLAWTVSAASSANRAWLETRLDQCVALAGRRVSLSFRYKASAAFAIELIQNFGSNGSAAISTALPSQPASNQWRLAIVSVILPSLTGRSLGLGAFLALRFSVSQAATIQLAELQLEEGFRTPYERRPNAYELTLCRYFFRRSAIALSLSDLTMEMRMTPRQSGTGPFDYDAEFEAA